jgi:hypothetical protein
MVGRGERQFRVMNLEATALDIEEPAGAAEIVQQMTVHMQKISIFADARNDVLVPNLGQHRTARLSQDNPPVWHLGLAAPPPTAIFARLVIEISNVSYQSTATVVPLEPIRGSRRMAGRAVLVGVAQRWQWRG